LGYKKAYNAAIAREFFLDLSDFNQDSHNFHHFVDDLALQAAARKRKKQRQLSKKQKEPLTTDGESSEDDCDLRFEDTLLYLCLPNLGRYSNEFAHTSVSRLFTWLYEKGVRTIMEVNITDNLLNPLSDDLIQQDLLNRFEIHSLDWQRVDVNLDTLTSSRVSLANEGSSVREVSSVIGSPSGAESSPTFKALKLYSSGNWSVLYHWQSSEGLCKLTHVYFSFLPVSQALRVNRHLQLKQVSIIFVEPRFLVSCTSMN
jgi:hypothetical protein